MAKFLKGLTEVLMGLLIVCLIVGVTVALLSTVVPSVAQHTTGAVEIPARIQHTITAVNTPVGAGKLEMTEAAIRVPIKGKGAFALVVLMSLPTMALLFLGLLWARDIFKAVASGEPFTAIVTQRLRLLSAAVFGWVALQGILDIVVHLTVLRTISLGSDFRLILQPINPIGLFCGLALLLLSEIFRYGTDLRVESELTV